MLIDAAGPMGRFGEAMMLIDAAGPMGRFGAEP